MLNYKHLWWWHMPVFFHNPFGSHMSQWHIKFGLTFGICGTFSTTGGHSKPSFNKGLWLLLVLNICKHCKMSSKCLDWDMIYYSPLKKWEIFDKFLNILWLCSKIHDPAEFHSIALINSKYRQPWGDCFRWKTPGLAQIKAIWLVKAHLFFRNSWSKIHDHRLDLPCQTHFLWKMLTFFYQRYSTINNNWKKKLLILIWKF